jgi:hypothetical protein
VPRYSSAHKTLSNALGEASNAIGDIINRLGDRATSHHITHLVAVAQQIDTHLIAVAQQIDRHIDDAAGLLRQMEEYDERHR